MYLVVFFCLMFKRRNKLVVYIFYMIDNIMDNEENCAIARLLNSEKEGLILLIKGIESKLMSRSYKRNPTVMQGPNKFAKREQIKKVRKYNLDISQKGNGY